MKKCGFIIRVSTDRQARNEEGSLKNQLQKLQAHIKYKNQMGEEEWIEAGQYILKGISGKDSIRSEEFGKLFEDIKIGKVNTILFTDLDRVSRSMKDLLNFFEFLKKYNIEFVCLNQNYDTTSPHGELIVRVIASLSEYERKITAQRTKDATLARAERGLWNGGRILGYDLDPNRKGYLIPNEREKIIVNFSFDTYLRCGSILETVKILKEHGFRTKEYQSRRETFHPAHKFTYSTVQQMLSNYAYIGKKEIGKKKRGRDQTKLCEEERYRIVNAVWEGIVEEDKFYKVQALIKKNHTTGHNVAKAVKHNYLLNGGLLWCEKCNKDMEGRSGTGAKGIRYYYYVCKNKCGFKVSADEIEGIVINRLKELSHGKDVLDEIIKFTNGRLQKELPQLKKQRTLLVKELSQIKNFAEGIMDQWESLAKGHSNAFVKEKLDKLGERRKDIEKGIQSLDDMIGEIEQEAVNRELVMLALNKFTDVFSHIQAHHQKELLRLVLHKTLLSPDKIKIALYGRPPEIGQFPLCEPEIRSQMPTWLPGQDSNLQPSG
jgi:site-specific DNA recombinase